MDESQPSPPAEDPPPSDRVASDPPPSDLLAPEPIDPRSQPVMPGRTVALVIGVLLLQLGFITSYVGAFHAPKPQRIGMVLVAPQQVAGKLAGELNAITGQPIRVRPVADAAEAQRLVRAGLTSAALVIDPASTRDTLYVTSAGGAAVETAVTTVVQRAEATQRRTVAVRDLVPVQAGDARGLTGFYLVVGWMVGGYLVASLVGITTGARPPSIRHAAWRLGLLGAYAIASGLGGALIVGPVLGALNGHLVALWWLGALIVFAAGAATTALEALFGILGIGVAILLFVILGNPSAGGAYQTSLLPPFWRALAYVLPPGAGTDAVRRIVYFGGQGLVGHLLVLAAWAVGGALVTVLVSARRLRPAPGAEPVAA